MNLPRLEFFLSISTLILHIPDQADFQHHHLVVRCHKYQSKLRYLSLQYAATYHQQDMNRQCKIDLVMSIAQKTHLEVLGHWRHFYLNQPVFDLSRPISTWNFFTGFSVDSYFIVMISKLYCRSLYDKDYII